MNTDSSSQPGRPLRASAADQLSVDRNGSTPPVAVVLATHDDSLRSELCARFEQDGGFVLAAAKTNATQALGATLFHSPRVCLLALDLPGELAARIKSIRAERPETRIGILVRSAAQPGLLGAVLAGADGVLMTSKPPKTFAAEVHALARGERIRPTGGSELDDHEPAGQAAQLEIDELEYFSPSSRRTPLVITGQHSEGRLTAAVLYVPRFSSHLRRRLRSRMPLSVAWESARQRMGDYR